jgi:rhodanese-related sulfurtransferase
MTRYINHIHMIVSDKNISRWEDKMFTQNVLCKINKEDYLRHVRIGTRVIINALDKEYNIPGTDGNILYKEAQKMNPEQLRKLVMDISVSKSIKHKNLTNIKNIHKMPLIVYCHNPKCDAAKLLTEELYKAGFNDILYFSGGFLGYHNRI